MIKRPKPIDEEVIFNGRSLISETDTKGIITFTNRKFTEMTGYTREEAVGQPHSILRHPDMPQAAFAKIWETIEGGQVWNGLVKNLRKDGLYYWVDAEILPIVDNENSVTGYIAVGKQASRKDINENKALYAKMLEVQK